MPLYWWTPARHRIRSTHGLAHGHIGNITPECHSFTAFRLHRHQPSVGMLAPLTFGHHAIHQSNKARHIRLPLGEGSHHSGDRKSTRLNSSHVSISYAVFCLKKKINALV